MTSHIEQVENLQKRAQELKKKIPFSVKFHPDVKAGNQLQAECFELMLDMADLLDDLIGERNGKN